MQRLDKACPDGELVDREGQLITCKRCTGTIVTPVVRIVSQRTVVRIVS